MARFRDDRTYWNQRYRESSHSSRLPDSFLLEAYERYVAPRCIRPGKALDVAGGVGRHAVWLARRGWDVTLVDISEVGLERARTAAAKSLSGQGQVDFVAADLERWRPGRSAFDLVLVFFYLQRSLFPALKAALKPGGLLIYKTYTLEHRKYARGPNHPMYCLRDNELLRAFSSLRVLSYRESVGIAELVARKNL